MLFNSYTFLFAFLPITLLGFLILRKYERRTWVIGWLAMASVVYYGYWKPELLLLLFGSIAGNFLCVTLLLRVRSTPRMKTSLLVLGIAFNLGLLGYFKYTGFFLSNLNAVTGIGMPIPDIVLPIGISFITFQQIALLVDASRGQVRDFSPLHHIFFISFFPQLIAGPIVHHSEIMPQLERINQRSVRDDIVVGLCIFIVGLFKKVVIADTFAVYADAGYGMVQAGQSPDPASAWIAALSYCLQIYYDFSGYSDMAVGLGRMFGIRLPTNFFSPYKSTSIVEFWRRWHMTLSRFLRDYLYFPLGGNRRGIPRKYLNLTVVMLFGGLWHGANWTFVIWGLVHGVLLALTHAWQRLPISRWHGLGTPVARGAAVGLTFILVTLAWVPFRAETLEQTLLMANALFPSDPGILFASFYHAATAQFGSIDVASWFTARELWPPVLPTDYLATKALPAGWILLIGLGVTFLWPNTYQIFDRFEPTVDHTPCPNRAAIIRLDWRHAAVLGAMLVLCILRLSHVSPFLYFQF